MDVVMRKKDAMSKKECYICPKIQAKLEEMKKISHGWIARYNGADQYEVQGPTLNRYVVCLKESTCGCNRWQLSGVPCVHAIACMNKRGHDVEPYVHPCHTRDMYMRCYFHALMPMLSHMFTPANDGFEEQEVNNGCDDIANDDDMLNQFLGAKRYEMKMRNKQLKSLKKKKQLEELKNKNKASEDVHASVEDIPGGVESGEGDEDAFWKDTTVTDLLWNVATQESGVTKQSNTKAAKLNVRRGAEAKDKLCTENLIGEPATQESV